MQRLVDRSQSLPIANLVALLFIVSQIALQCFVVEIRAQTDQCIPLPKDTDSYPCELDDVELVEIGLRNALAQVGRMNGGGGGKFSENVHVFCDPKKGRGLKVTGKGFSKSEIVIRLPLVGLLTSQSYLNGDKVEPINHLDALALTVLEQKNYGTNHYVDTLHLQTGVMTAFRLCDKDLEDHVKDADVRESARAMRDAIRERGEELMDLGVVKSVDEYEKVLSIVQSRVFVIPIKKENNEWAKVPSLVMIADTMNLSMDPNTDCLTNEQSSHFECFATRDIADGEELTAPFVKHSEEIDLNSFTWFHYGFQFDERELSKQDKQSSK